MLVRVAGTILSLPDSGAKVIPISADISQAADVAKVVPTVIEQFGRIDILINNAA